MKKIVIFIYFIVMLGNTSFSQQEWFLNVGAGPMNYTGDLLDKQFSFKEMKYNGSVGLSYQYLPNLFFNASLTVGKIGAMDIKNGRKWYYRNLSFQTMIYEGAVTAEYDLYDISQPENAFNNENPQKFTPYIFAGVGLFHFNPYAYDVAGKKTYLQPLGTEGQTTPYSLWQVCFPYGIGGKYAINSTTVISAEFSVRKLLTDYLDDVSQHKYPDSLALLQSRGAEAVALSYRANEIPNSPYIKENGYRGEPSKKDGYYSFVVKVSFQLFTSRPKFYYGY